MTPQHWFRLLAFAAFVPVPLVTVWSGALTYTQYLMTVLVLAAIPVNLYPLVYVTRPWWITAAGRALMVKAVGNMILIDLALATAVFGHDYPGRDVLRALGFTIFTIGVWYLFVTLLKAGRRSRYDDLAAAGSDPGR